MAKGYKAYKSLLADLVSLSTEYLSDTLPPISDDPSAFALYKSYIKRVCSDGTYSVSTGVVDEYLTIYGLLYTLESSDPDVVGSFAGALRDINDPTAGSDWARLQVTNIGNICSIFGFDYYGPGL